MTHIENLDDPRSKDDNNQHKKNGNKQLTKVCTVCGGGAASHLHYGAVSCYSCRAFFRRGIGRTYTCINDDSNCEIDCQTRRSCQLCRFNKCLKVGMSVGKIEESPRSRTRRASSCSSKDSDTPTQPDKSSKPILIQELEPLEQPGILHQVLKGISFNDPRSSVSITQRWNCTFQHSENSNVATTSYTDQSSSASDSFFITMGWDTGISSANWETESNITTSVDSRSWNSGSSWSTRTSTESSTGWSTRTSITESRKGWSDPSLIPSPSPGFDDVTSMFGLGVTLSTGKDEKPSSCGSRNPISPDEAEVEFTDIFSVPVQGTAGNIEPSEYSTNPTQDHNSTSLTYITIDAYDITPILNQDDSIVYIGSTAQTDINSCEQRDTEQSKLNIEDLVDEVFSNPN
ncbi:nuclear receptor subfamily 2 group C member 2 isoform X2 [Eurytemora carolleeae]|uniref:nuclear receptor subfamily 2 group C member 2 isoform X2 n=1 Tax=Eurytemora carolleeae TaxID=1294199 RepID=UPI000C769A0F|nr:nuclear receptor subfamily 2 group C member 2 isoform X2 [Eurytemora carolleeae]|eukprot:XP_023322617.1 nuclear receptor subfamily 2 group C member 2-like isoform X2 [Eurytemora affinis]